MSELKKEITIDEHGKARLTVEGLAQILTIDADYLSESIAHKELNKVFLADGATQDEIDCWLVGGIPDVMVPLVLIYFAMETDNVPAMAKKAAQTALNGFYNLGLQQLQKDPYNPSYADIYTRFKP